MSAPDLNKHINEQTNKHTIRQACVAGSFYPASQPALSALLNECLLYSTPAQNTVPKALIVPHAGYIYSGAIAGAAYSLLAQYKQDISRVIIFGPSHRVPVMGCATSGHHFFATPLGNIKLDIAIINELEKFNHVKRLEKAHAHEHSLEVQLPFLQKVLQQFTLVPLVVGHWDNDSMKPIFEMLSNLSNTLIIISTDLSHFHPYKEAQAIDENTHQAILNFQSTLDGEQACGSTALNGLLHWAKVKGWNIKNCALKNSGDSAGDKNSVVGYASYVLYE